MSTALLLAGVVLGLLCPVGASAGGFSSARFVSPKGELVDDGAGVAINKQGRLAVAWIAGIVRGRLLIRDELQARVGQVGRRLAPVQRLARRGVEVLQPAVAVGADGTAIVGWIETLGHGRERVRVAVAGPGHRFAPAQTISEGRGRLEIRGLTIDANGRAVLVWAQSQTDGVEIRYALRPRHGEFQGLDSGIRAWGNAGVQTGVDGRSGDLLIGWVAPLGDPGESNQDFMASLSPDATTFSQPVPLPEATSGSFVFASGPGGAGYGYESPRAHNNLQLRLVPRNADGSLGPAQDIALARLRGVGFLLGPFINQAQSGATVAVWDITQAPNGDNSDVVSKSKVLAAFRPARSQTFDIPRTLSPSSAIAEYTASALVGDRTVVVWRESGPDERPPVRLVYRTIGAYGTITPGAVLPGAFQATVRLASNTRHAVAVWFAFNGISRLRLAIYTP